MTMTMTVRRDLIEYQFCYVQFRAPVDVGQLPVLNKENL